jgi:hypothetical protein
MDRTYTTYFYDSYVRTGPSLSNMAVLASQLSPLTRFPQF